MAGQEELGKAVLTLLVDLDTFKSQIDAAKSYVQRELGQIEAGTAKRPSQTQTSAAGQKVTKQRLGGLNASWSIFLDQLKEVKQDIDAANRAKRTSGLGGRISSGLVGGAFPLLFGQGPGAAIGGGLGGLAGGSKFGFGLSLVGTTLGQAFDLAITKGTELASALQDPVNSLDKLTASSVLSSKGLEKQVEALAGTGRAAEAAALAQLDLLNTYGDISGLESLTNAQDEFNRTVAKLQISVAAFVSGPLTDFLTKLNKGLQQSAAPPPTKPTQLSQALSVSGGLLALLGGLSIATGAGAPAGLALLGAGAGLTAAAQQTTVPESKDLAASLKELDAALKLAENIRASRERINNLRGIEIELTKNISVEDRKILKDAAAQLKYEEAVAVAKNNKVKLSQAEYELELDKAKNQKEFLADSFRGNQIALQQVRTLFDAYQKLRAAQEAQQLTPKYGQTQSSRVVEAVQGQINGAIAGEERAIFQLSQAYAQLANARERGTLADIAEAETAVAAARADLETAGINVKIAIQEGATTLLENAETAAKRFRDATRSLRDLLIGNLRFLPAAQREDVVRKEIEKALPEARSRGVTLRGIEDVFSFNRFIEQESSALQERSDAQRNLADANDSLKSEIVTQTGALNTLTERLSQLIDKSWSVYVEVPGQNGAAPINMSNQLN